MTDGEQDFDARDYWSRRLTAEWSLRGTGHISYSAGYNRWLYRAKRRVIRRALRHIRRGAALDVGSGVGWVVALLQDLGWSVSGCDLTEVSVQRLAQRFPNLRFDVVNAGQDDLPAGAASCDLVTVIDVAFHLIDDGQVEHLADETARVLRPGGIALVTDSFGPDDEQPEAHVRFRGRPTWDAALAGTSLRMTRLFPYFRLLSRPPEDARLLHHLPGRVRGAIEYTVDATLPLPPHMRLAVLERR